MPEEEKVDFRDLEKVPFFVHNVVIKFAVTDSLNCPDIAVNVGGLCTREYHAGPTSIWINDPIKSSFRLFRNNKVNAAGLKSMPAAIAAVWIFLWKVVRVNKIVSKPIYIQRTNVQMSGYFPWKVDLKKFQKTSRGIAYNSLISCARCSLTDYSKMKLSLYEAAFIITGALDVEEARRAITKIYPNIYKCRGELIDSLNVRSNKALEGEMLLKNLRDDPNTIRKKRRKRTHNGRKK